MRSCVGAACPFTRFDRRLDELFPDLLVLLTLVPADLVWVVPLPLAVLLWLVLAGALCAAAAGSVKPPAAVAARIHPTSACLERNVRMSGLMRLCPLTCRRPAQRPAETP
jgi:hypothetical protein